MLRLSKLSDYAIMILASLPERAGAPVSASSLADKTGLPEPTVSKVLKLLSAANDLVISTRGIKGGYVAAHPLNSMSIADVITAVEGPIALTTCVDGGDENCTFAAKCPMKGRWDMVNNVIKNTLKNITLDDILNSEYERKRA